MRVRKSIEISEQQRFRIFSAIQIWEVFEKNSGGLTVDYYYDVNADVILVKLNRIYRIMDSILCTVLYVVEPRSSNLECFPASPSEQRSKE